MRVIEFLTDAATKPTVVKTAALKSPDEISQADTLNGKSVGASAGADVGADVGADAGAEIP